MQKVRFTIEEIKGNLKFLFWVCTFTITALIAAQLWLMKLEHQSYSLHKEWSTNEAFVTNFQNAFYTTHDVQFAITKEYATTVSQSIQMFEYPEVLNGPYKEKLEDWKSALEYVLDSRGYDGMKQHDHQKCIGLNANKNYLVNQTRLSYTTLFEALQNKIDLLHLIILFLPIIVFAIIIYTAFFVNYGGEA